MTRRTTAVTLCTLLLACASRRTEAPKPPEATSGGAAALPSDGCEPRPDGTSTVVGLDPGAARLRLLTSPGRRALVYMTVERRPLARRAPVATPLLARVAPDPRDEIARPPRFEAVFTSWYQRLDAGGRPSGAPVSLGRIIPHGAASSDDGARAALIAKEGTNQYRLVVLDTSRDPVRVIARTALPMQGIPGDTGAIAFDPGRRRWGLLWTEQGSGRSRPAFALADEGGTLIGGRIPIAPMQATHSVSLSDWTNPLIWAGDGYATVWSEGGAQTGSLLLVRIAPEGTVRRVVVSPTWGSRAVVAWAGGDRFGVAWGQREGGHSNLRAAVVVGAHVSPEVHLGDDAVQSAEPAIAWDGQRFAVSFHEGQGRSHLHYALLDPTGRRLSLTRLSDATFDGHEWSQDLRWDGCRFLLAYQHRLNPSEARIHAFSPAR